MIIEVEGIKDNIDKIKNHISTLKSEDNLIIIQNGINLFDKNNWKSFLIEDCGLYHDKRHYSYKENIALEDWWEISYQPDKATSYAYSNTRQPLHTDNGWFSDPAEINFFFMQKQASKGGEQTIYSLKRLINDLESIDRTLLDDLKNTKVTISKGTDQYSNNTCIINTENEPRIFWNYYRTDKTDPNIKKMCDAFFDFLKTQENTHSVAKKRMNSGDCFCFNDQKMLHGRLAFETNNPYDRILFQSMWKIIA